MTRIALAVITFASLLAASLGLNSLTTSQSATQSAPERALASVATQATGRPTCVVTGDLVGDANPADVARALCP